MRLHERDEELQRIAEAIASARAGTGVLMALERSAGIGKTRLLRAAMELAAENMAVISARGGQMEAEFAFGVARQLCEPVLAVAAVPASVRMGIDLGDLRGPKGVSRLRFTHAAAL